MFEDPRGNIVRQRYYEKETGVVGDETNMAETLRRWWNHANARMYRLFPGRITGRVLDIGCNAGMMSLLIAKDPAVSSVTGVDVLYEAVDAAERYKAFVGDTKCHFRVMDFTLQVPLDSESYESAVTFHTLEHIYPRDLPAFMTNLYDVLKPWGKVLISIPYMASYWDPGHKTIFDVKKLRELFSGYGFVAESVTCRYPGVSTYDDKILTGLFVRRE